MSIDGIKKREIVAEDGEDQNAVVEQMADRELQHLRTAEMIDQEIQAIQRSTRVLMPWLSAAHNYCRMAMPWYYKWHMNGSAVYIHYLVLLIFILSTLYICFISG